MSEKQVDTTKLNEALERLINNENNIFFLTYSTNNNARAAIKYIYDTALTLKNEGFNAKILVENNDYVGVENWMGDVYKDLEVVSIKEDQVQIKIDDILVIPEYYGNVLEQVSNIRCIKVMLVQQKENMFETLPIGSRYSDYGFDKIITTTNITKNYIKQIFPESLIYVIPPMIGDNFKPSEEPLKPYIAIHCRDRIFNRKIISEFYLKFPQLRWISFRDMVQLSYKEFSEALQECAVSVWADDTSTFGTFPIESMKCNIPIVGKIPNTEPEWLKEANGMWTYDNGKIVDILGTYILSWLEGVEVSEEVKTDIKETLVNYESDITKNNIISVFNSFKTNRIETIKNTIEAVKEE